MASRDIDGIPEWFYKALYLQMGMLIGVVLMVGLVGITNKPSPTPPLHKLMSNSKQTIYYVIPNSK